jgi:phytoene desaturase
MAHLLRDGFTVETRPKVLTMPELIADAVRAASRDRNANLHELLPMRRRDAAHRAGFADGSTINVRYGREAMREGADAVVCTLDLPTAYQESTW